MLTSEKLPKNMTNRDLSNSVTDEHQMDLLSAKRKLEYGQLLTPREAEVAMAYLPASEHPTDEEVEQNI